MKSWASWAQPVQRPWGRSCLACLGASGSQAVEAFARPLLFTLRAKRALSTEHPCAGGGSGPVSEALPVMQSPLAAPLTRDWLSVPSSVGALSACDLRPAPKGLHSPQPTCHLLAEPTTPEDPPPRSAGPWASLFSSLSNKSKHGSWSWSQFPSCAPHPALPAFLPAPRTGQEALGLPHAPRLCAPQAQPQVQSGRASRKLCFGLPPVSACVEYSH